MIAPRSASAPTGRDAPGEGVHRIRRLVFELRYPDEPTAFAVRARLEPLAADLAQPVLDEVFDAFVDGDDSVVIDRLEVDLGRWDPDRLGVEPLRERLRTELGRVLGRLPPGARRVVPRTVALEAALAAFLETGTFGWPPAAATLDELGREIRTRFGSRPGRLTDRLRVLLRRAGPAYRLVQQFGPGFADWALELLRPGATRELGRIGPDALAGLGPAEAKAILLRAVARLPADAAPERVLAEVRRLRRARHRGPPAGSAESRSQAGAVEPRPGPEPPASALEAGGESGVAYTRYAGAVLLHPFLPRFFDRLKLLDARGRFRSASHRVRAVHLLHYLATGRGRPAEPDTPLLKLLCGHPLHAPLPRVLSLRRREAAEAGLLLRAVVRHWSRVGNTSPDGLREGFLQRDGRLEPVETGSKLTVEQRAVDVLLDTLPWALGPVRLPWMEAALTVDWT